MFQKPLPQKFSEESFDAIANVSAFIVLHSLSGRYPAHSPALNEISRDVALVPLSVLHEASKFMPAEVAIKRQATAR